MHEVIARILRTAREDPDKTALIYFNIAFSYRRFANLIAAMQRYLVSQDIPPGSTVLLRNPENVVNWCALLALNAAGMTTLVCEQHTQIAVLRMPIDVEVRLEHAAPVAQGAADRHRVVTLPTALLTGALPDDAPPVQRDDGAHVLLSSGTTGRPKAVRLDAGAMHFRCREAALSRGLDETSVLWLGNIGIWTVLGFGTPLAVWHTGGTVVIDDDDKAEPGLARQGLTHAHALPITLKKYLASERPFPRNDGMKLMTGGYAIPRAMAQAVQTKISANFFELVGTTETSLITWTRIGPDCETSNHQLLPFVVVEVVDGEDNVLPPGTPGRLRIKVRDGLTGYWNDPAGTAEHFRHGYFYAGDYAVISADRHMRILGRVDDQLNLAGQKLWPQPVESAIAERLGVNGVCLVVLPEEADLPLLRVVVEAPTPIAEGLLEQAREELRFTGFVTWHFTPTLPRNHMGKLLRSQVAEMTRIATAKG